MRAVRLVVLLVLNASCTSAAKRQQAMLKEAQVHFDAALEALRRGDLDAAHQQHQAGVTAVEKLRRSAAPPMSEYDGEGPTVNGLSAQEWENRWVARFTDELETQLPSLIANTQSGTLDWNRGRSFITTYRPDLDARWLDAVEGAKTAEVRPLKDTILFRCQSAATEVCTAVKNALSTRAARPLTDKVLLDGDAKHEMVGLITVDVSYDAWRSYAGVTDPSKNTVFSLPGSLTVSLSVETHHGQSSWDGSHPMVAHVEPPTAVDSSDVNGAGDRHFKALLDEVLAKLAQLPAQTLN